MLKSGDSWWTDYGECLHNPNPSRNIYFIRFGMRPGASSLSFSSYDDMYDMHLRDLSALGTVRIENPKSDAGK